MNLQPQPDLETIVNQPVRPWLLSDTLLQDSRAHHDPALWLLDSLREAMPAGPLQDFLEDQKQQFP